MRISLFFFSFFSLQFFLGKGEPIYFLGAIPSFYLLSLLKNKMNLTSGFELSRRAYKIILGIIIILSFLRVGQISRKIFLKKEVRTEDIAVVYFKSVESLFRKRINPYSLDLDPYPFSYKGDSYYFKRAKYTPLQILTYAPFMLSFGLRGVYVANLFSFLFLIYVFFSISKKWGIGRQYIGLIFILGTEFAFNKIFSKGVNDLLPAILLLLSWSKLRENKSSTAGILLGFSFLAKQLPAGLGGLIYLFQRRFKAFLYSVPLIIIFCFPFFISEIKEIWENLFLFNIIRPVRETSVLIYLPSLIQKLSPFFVICLICYLSIKNKKLTWFLGAISLTLFILFSKMSPGNYFIWAWPFWILYSLEPQENFTKGV